MNKYRCSFFRIIIIWTCFSYITGINLTRKKLNLQLLNYYDEIDDLKFLNFKHNEINDIINKINNDYNFNFHETINIKELQNYVESIYKKVSVIHKR